MDQCNGTNIAHATFLCLGSAATYEEDGLSDSGGESGKHEIRSLGKGCGGIDHDNGSHIVCSFFIATYEHYCHATGHCQGDGEMARLRMDKEALHVDRNTLSSCSILYIMIE